MEHYVVIGAGQAGQSLVTKLRSEGFEGRVSLIGEEPVPPYQRPPLSKAYLLGEMEVERLYLRPEQFYGDHDIALHLGQAVDAIDRQARTISMDGQTIAYDKLALTTGSAPIRLPASIGGDLSGVYTVRTLADVDGIAHEFAPDARALIVGGGYIGLEAAAVAAKKGLRVTLVEMAPRILQRVAARQTADFIRAKHLSHGVKMIEGDRLSRLVGDDRVTSAVLADGTELAVDFVVIGVGIRPETGLAQAAGLTIDNGISTDEFCQTSDASIWAAGDCASFPYRGRRIRLESVGNAIHHAETAALNMLGRAEPYEAKPWFWSDQYDLKLQIAGLHSGFDRIVTRQEPTEGSVSFWYYAGDNLLAVDAMNDPRGYMVGKRLIEMGKSPDAAAVADPDTPLKSLLQA